VSGSASISRRVHRSADRFAAHEQSLAGTRCRPFIFIKYYEGHFPSWKIQLRCPYSRFFAKLFLCPISEGRDGYLQPACATHF